MKILSTTALALALMATIATISPASCKTIKGSRTMITKAYEVDLEGVTTLRTQNCVEVEIVDAAVQPNITVKANENIMPYLEIEIKGERLTVSISNKIRSVRNVDIEVQVPNNGTFNTFVASSASEISSELFLRVPSLVIEASSAADVDLTAIVDGDCLIEASSAADVTLTAKVAGRCKVDASSAADVDLTLTAEELSVEASSAADVDAQGSANKFYADLSSGSSFDGDEFKVQQGSIAVSSGSSVEYYGVGQFEISRSSGGSVKNTNPNK